MLMLTCTSTCRYESFRNTTPIKMLTFYMDRYTVCKSPKFLFPLTLPLKTLCVPGNLKISSEVFVDARAPWTRPSAPHDHMCSLASSLFPFSVLIVRCVQCTNSSSIYISYEYLYFFTCS